MIKKITFLLLLTIALTNCAKKHNFPLSEENKINLEGRNLVVISKSSPFYAITNHVYKPSYYSHGLAVGMVGSMINSDNKFLFTEENKNKGSEIVSENNIKDPNSLIKEAILEDFKKKYNPKTIEYGDYFARHPWRLANKYNNSDLALYIRTLNWYFKPGTQNPPQYYVVYSGSIGLVDLKSEKIIAKGLCSNLASKTSNNVVQSYKYEDLLKNKAEILKKELDSQANECIRKFKDEILYLN